MKKDRETRESWEEEVDFQIHKALVKSGKFDQIPTSEHFELGELVLAKNSYCAYSVLAVSERFLKIGNKDNKNYYVKRVTKDEVRKLDDYRKAVESLQMEDLPEHVEYYALRYEHSVN